MAPPGPWEEGEQGGGLYRNEIYLRSIQNTSFSRERTFRCTLKEKSRCVVCIITVIVEEPAFTFPQTDSNRLSKHQEHRMFHVWLSVSWEQDITSQRCIGAGRILSTRLPRVCVCLARRSGESHLSLAVSFLASHTFMRHNRG